MTKIFHASLFLLSSLLFQFGFCQTVPPKADLNLPATASWSFYAIDAQTGQHLFSTPQRSLTPASTQKLMTTAAALEILGPEFRFTTKLEYSGKLDTLTGTLQGDLILTGGCDPAFYSDYFAAHYKDLFANWASGVKAAGITKVEGALLLDLSAMDRNPIPGGWVWEDIGNYFGAGVSALSFRDNLYTIHFQTEATPGKIAAIKRITPEIKDLTLSNRVISSDTPRDQSVIFGSPGNYRQFIEGTLPKGRENFAVKGAMPDPADVAAREFLNSLHSANIQIPDQTEKIFAVTQQDRNTIASFDSPPLRELIIPLNKESINLFAEHLLREIGRKVNGTPTVKAGCDALVQFCMERKIDAEGFFPEDGSGLSRSNAITPRTLVETIFTLSQSANEKYFKESLSVAATDGTLQNTFTNTFLANNLRGKTGSMERVRSMAGIYKTQDGRSVIFCFIINNSPQTSREINQTIFNILTSL